MFPSLSLLLNIVLTVLVIAAVIFAVLLIIGAVAIRILLVKPPVFNLGKPNKLMGDEFPLLVKKTLSDTDKITALPHTEVTVTTDDGIDLKCNFFINPKPTSTTVLCIHGYNSYGYWDFASRALAYLDSGYNVFIANLRHTQSNGGKYIGFGVLEKNDVIKFIEYINSVYPDGSIFMQGISMGGATVMQASSHDLTPNLKGIIDDCGFTSVKDEIVFQFHKTAHLPAFPMYNILNMYAKVFAKYDFSSSDSRREVAKSKVPILFIHGDNDAFVPCFMGKECYEACTAEKELYIVKGASHAAAYFKAPEEYMKHMNSFIEKYAR